MMYWNTPLTISGTRPDVTPVTLSSRTILAPMAGVSDLPFRLLCHDGGAGLVSMEMISAKAVTYHNGKTWDLMKTVPAEAPVSLQLFGHEPDVIGEAVRLIEEREQVYSKPVGLSIAVDVKTDPEMSAILHHDLLDLNMGCPVPKIFNNGDGSALMKDPALIEQIVSAAVRASSRPVTCKMRIGPDDTLRNAPDCARAAEAAGASMITVHGRTRPQMYGGKADLAAIAEVKKAVRIPVSGNGDVRDGLSALRMFLLTGCDAVSVGRGAEGNPWVFGVIRDYLAEAGPIVEALRQAGKEPEEILAVAEREIRPAPKPTGKILKETILRQARLALQYKSPRVAMHEMRSHVAWYLAGFPGASRVRGRVNDIETYEDLENLLTEVLG